MEKLNKKRKFIPLKIAVLTVSDTRNIKNDKSGDILQKLINKNKHTMTQRNVVKDDVGEIQSVIKKWTENKNVDVIITTGGTGFTGKDVTPEAVEPMFTKKMDGFSIVFHQMSLGKIGTSTVQSRTTAGLINNKFVFCLPGSPNAVKDAWENIIRKQLDYRTMPCNFVEIMPRLDEHLRRK